MAYVFINDSYTARRGEPAMLELCCAKCNHYLFTYQKDGPGPLLRCYWDRIHAPDELKNAVCNSPDDKSLNVIVCRYCEQVIGTKGVYEKEQRLAFFLVEGSFVIRPLEQPALPEKIGDFISGF